MTDQFCWFNALSTRPSLEGAVREVAQMVRRQFSGTPDVGIFFIASSYASEYPRLLPLLTEAFPETILMGCGGGGIIGVDPQLNALELEDQPALSLSVGCFPEVAIATFHLSTETLPDLDAPPQCWVEQIGVDPALDPQFVLLADPFSARMNDLLEGLDYAYPKAVKVGGLAGSGVVGVPNGLFLYHPQQGMGKLYRDGTVGLALSGKIKIETIVAQGCRPIGPPYRVERAERNIILELAGESDEIEGGRPLEVLREIIRGLDAHDRELAQTSLFVGVVRDVFKTDLKRGDFLIRSLLGVDPKEGAVAVGDRIRPGQRVQFHLRDAQTSADDLTFHLQEYRQRWGQQSLGALMFACLGRGEGLYGEAHFDSRLFQEHLGTLPVGGFFCNGEIGPVGGNTFLHGYTSVFGVLRPLE
ncbi:MAG: FIST N-terminal domain-containing protein [Cyanobacteria bacterium P01_G01_bin.54]